MIKQFDNKKEFLNYIKSNVTRKIGNGSEGNVYLCNDGDVIKTMIDSFTPKHYGDYPNIIMDDSLKLDSFIFPKELYLSNGLIVGYKEKFFSNDILYSDVLSDIIDIDQLVKARDKFIEDAKVITNKGYRLYELPYNLLFDNKKLVAIDTLDYIKKSNVTLKENIDIIDNALLLELYHLYPNIDVTKPFNEEIGKVYSYKKKKLY